MYEKNYYNSKLSKYIEFSKKIGIISKKSFLAILGPKKANFMILGNFHGFLQNFQKKWKLEVPLAQKLRVVWKKCPRLKKFKILWTFAWNRIHIKKIIFGHFRAQNVLLKKSIFFEFFSKIFQAQSKIGFTSAWKKKCSNFLKVETISFYPLFLSSKNLYKWLLKLKLKLGIFLKKVPRSGILSSRWNASFKVDLTNLLF